MSKGMLGKKLGMTGHFSPQGEYLPVTLIEAGPCTVTQIKTIENDGYNALQLGFEEKKDSRATRPLLGHFKKSGEQCFYFLREFPVDNPEDYSLGQKILLDIFNVGDRVDIVGTTKGRGFSGVVRRHGFHGGRKSHGSKSHRLPGSIGCSATPSKVVKGKKLPGQHGNQRHTARNLVIVDIRLKENLLLIKGAVPGAKSGLVEIKKPKFSK